MQMHMDMHIHIPARAYIQIHTYIHTYIHIYTNVCLCVRERLYVCCACFYGCVCDRTFGLVPDPYKGPIQDWRFYNGVALTADHISEIAMDTTAPAQRTCVLPDEAPDSGTFVDILGHDCGWVNVVSCPSLLCISLTTRRFSGIPVLPSLCTPSHSDACCAQAIALALKPSTGSRRR